MTTLHQAAQRLLEAIDAALPHAPHRGEFDFVSDAADTLRAALAEPVQEPVEISSEWQPCVKLPVTVHVRAQRLGETHVSTREGITPVKEDDLIMRGVSGEEYPIGRKIFERTYQLGEAPPKRKPLTDEEIDRITSDKWGTNLLGVIVQAHREYARAVEAAHDIKEQA